MPWTENLFFWIYVWRLLQYVGWSTRQICRQCSFSLVLSVLFLWHLFQIVQIAVELLYIQLILHHSHALVLQNFRCLFDYIDKSFVLCYTYGEINTFTLTGGTFFHSTLLFVAYLYVKQLHLRFYGYYWYTCYTTWYHTELWFHQGASCSTRLKLIPYWKCDIYFS